MWASNEFLKTEFGQIYTNLFVNQLFREDQQVFSRKDLKKKTVGSKIRKANCSWLFDSEVIRAKYLSLFN